MATIKRLHAAFGAILGLALSVQVADGAAAFKVLHAFGGGKDGYFPSYALTPDGSGNLYGVTYGAAGGPGKQCSKGCGNVYSLEHGSREHVIFYFDSKHGAVPTSPLLFLDGSFYGTTGTIKNHGQGGTAYRLTPKGKQSTLYTFCSAANCADGSFPYGHLVADSGGNLYGATIEGGIIRSKCKTFHDRGCGTLYSLASNGTQSVLYLFCSRTACADGYLPEGGLTIDSAGDLFGTTGFGGANDQGVAFELPAGGTYTVLYSFCAKAKCADGAQPLAGLTLDRADNLYGTTRVGGTGPCSGSPPGCGAIYRLDASGKETVLYSFAGGKADGKFPETRVIFDAQDNLYATTAGGGDHGDGIAFRLSTSSKETVLHDFCSEGHCADGEFPDELLLEGSHLFGAAPIGGTKGCECGVVFRLGK